MINQLGQSDYFSWSIMKSQPITNTLTVSCKEVANKLGGGWMFSPWRPPVSLTTDYNFHTGMHIIKRIVELLFSNKPFSDWWLPHISHKHVQPSISYHFFPHITSTRKIANLSNFLNFIFLKIYRMKVGVQLQGCHLGQRFPMNVAPGYFHRKIEEK